MWSRFEFALADWWSSEWHQSRSNYSVPGHHIRHRDEPEPIGRRKSPTNRLVIDAEKSRWLTGCERWWRVSGAAAGFPGAGSCDEWRLWRLLPVLTTRESWVIAKICLKCSQSPSRAGGSHSNEIRTSPLSWWCGYIVQYFHARCKTNHLIPWNMDET